MLRFGGVSKLIMISVLLFTIIAPIRASRDPVPAKGLKKLIRWTLIYLALWVFSLAFLLGRLFT